MIVKDNYTTQEIADYMGVDVQTIRRYIREGKIKVVKFSAKVQRIPHSEVAYLWGGKK